MNRHILPTGLGFVLALAFSACATPSQIGSGAEPAGEEGRQFVLATASPDATDAGADILRRGGSAVDAAVSVATVLGLVEPQSAGVGGGAFLVYWDADKSQLLTYDGRETAPASTQADQFMGDDGKPLGYFDKVIGGQSVGVPGMMAMLGQAHADHGKLKWAELMTPAEELAETGFEMSPRLSLVAGFMKSLKTQPGTHAYFYGGGETVLPPGTLIQNKDYADTMRTLAKSPRALNEGPKAEAIVAAALDRKTGKPNLTLADLAAYEPKMRAPVCGTYRTYKICGMGPPSSGGVTVLQILGLLERFDLSEMKPADPAIWHLYAEAMRLAYADRLTYLADPDFVSMPIDGLIDKSYLAERSALIDPNRAAGKRQAGRPKGADAFQFAQQFDKSAPSTTHFSIIDGEGNIVSMTASIEGPFGSHIMVEGFLLNNELTDFSARPTRDGKPVANVAGPGRRPLSSMSPTIVFDADGQPILVIGSPGGKSIISYVAKTLVGVLDLGLSLEEAIALPNIVNQNGDTRIEDIPEAAAIADALEARGHTVKRSARMTSGLNGLIANEENWTGAADKRREGTASSGHAETKSAWRFWQR